MTTDKQEQKFYVCQCGYVSLASPGFHRPGGPAIFEANLAAAGRICPGSEVRACYRCGNCGQWAHPFRQREKPTGEEVITWDCLNDCATRGLASNHRLVVG